MEQAHTSAQLLVVDDEEELLWSVSQRLRKERPAYRVSTATSGHDALDLLARTPFDVLVADLRMPAMSGMDLVIAARSLFPRLPVIVMTAYPSREIREKVIEGGAIEFLEKPFDFGHFVGALERAVARGKVGFSGAILVQTLPDIIQLYALSNSTGALEVHRPDRSGTIWFDRGVIPHAVAGNQTGAGAFYEIMTWQGGSFSMRAGEPPPEKTISSPWMELLMEACRLSDEETRGAPASDRGATDGELHSGWTLAPPALPTNPPTEETSPPPTDLETTNTQEGTVKNMANYKDSLSKLDSLDGFIGACLCDSESRGARG